MYYECEVLEMKVLGNVDRSDNACGYNDVCEIMCRLGMKVI